jgi:ADP-ribose pyrophosphatase
MKWKERKRKLIAPCRIFDLYQVQRRSPEGKEGSFYLLDAPDWVTVIPFTGSREELQEGKGSFLMVEQYRHGSDSVTMEFPAGTVEPGEDPGICALRELEEETGCRAGQLIELGSVNPNPAFMNNSVTFYLALELGKPGQQNLDEHEEIALHYHPFAEVLEKMGSGTWNNGVMMIALAFLQRFRGRI